MKNEELTAKNTDDTDDTDDTDATNATDIHRFTSLYREEGHVSVMPYRGDLAVGS